mgnify:CR=1 FL=1
MAVPKVNIIPPFFYGWIIVAASTIIMTLGLGMLQSFGIFFKPIAAEFQWTRDVTALAYSIIGIVEAIVTPLSGFFVDKYGPRTVLAISGVLAGLGYFLISQTHALWQFYIFFGLIIGVSSGASYTPIVSTINRWFVDKRGLALGIVVSGVGAGTMVIPPLAAYLIDSFGSWRMAYIILAALLGIGITGAAFLLRQTPQEKGLLPYGHAHNGRINGLKHDTNLSLRQALRHRAFWMIFFIGALSFGGLTLILVHLVNYATDPGIGLSPKIAATFISVIGLSSIAGKIGMGSISDKIGRKTALVICCGLAGAMMFFLPIAKSLWMLYIFSAVFGFAYGGWTPVLPAIVGELFGLRSMGVIFGATSLGGSLGSALFAYLGGAIFEMTKSYILAFIMGGGVLVIAALLVLLIKEPMSCKFPLPRGERLGEGD